MRNPYSYGAFLACSAAGIPMGETYQSRYENSEFEVIEESYNWGKAVLQGWLWIGDVPVCCIMDICFEGKMIYVIEELRNVL